jgi:bacterioferritin
MNESRPESAFLTDIKTLRENARQQISKGALTKGYHGDAEAVCRVLNQALATEIVCVLRYKRHYYMAKGIHAAAVKAEFLEHATEEQRHADMIAERITQLGGSPDFSPDGLLSRSHSEYVEGDSLVSMIREDLIAERLAIDSYRDIVAWLADFDTTSKRILEEIQAVEEEHADDLAELLERFPEEKETKA